MKKFIKHDGKKYRLALDRYMIGGRYALCLVVPDGEYEVISVNILDDDDNPVVPEDCICFDINESNPKIFTMLCREGFIENTGDIEFSGFCAYPVCRLNFEKIKEYSNEAVAY